MKPVLLIALSLFLFAAPLVASAQTYMNSDTESSADSGSNVVSSGGTVVTGDSYSSVSVEDIVGGGSGTSTVHIETDDNGQVKTQTITKTIPSGKEVEIDVATSTGGGSAQVHIQSFIGTKSSGATSGLRQFVNRLFGTPTSTASSSYSAFSATGTQGRFGFGSGIVSLLEEILGAFRFW